MQDYSIDLTKTVKTIIPAMKNGMDSTASNFSGTSAPTAQFVWQQYYNSTDKTTYTCTDVENNTWTDLLGDAKKAMLLAAHPVGCIYESTNSTSPATLFGGTWETLPAGYTLIAQGSGTDDFGSFTYTAGQKYGERMHKLTVEELPKNYISFRTIAWNGDNTNFVNVTTTQENYDMGWANDGAQIGGVTFTLSGGGLAQNNVTSSMAVYIWRRTA